MKPPGWRPTAFFWPTESDAAFTNAAVIDDNGPPVRELSDPLDATGILLEGPWVLRSYDEKWGHTRYERPADCSGANEDFRISGHTVTTMTTSKYNVRQVDTNRWTLRTNGVEELMGTVELREDRFTAFSANGTDEHPMISGPHHSLQEALDWLDEKW